MDIDTKIASVLFWCGLIVMIITGLAESWAVFIIATIIMLAAATYLVKNVK